MNRGRKPLLPGRGIVRVEELCAGTGLPWDVVAGLITGSRVQGVVDDRGRAWGLFADALPSRAELVALGLPVDEGYDPERLRGTADEEDDEEDDDEAGGPTWTMTWPGGPAPADDPGAGRS